MIDDMKVTQAGGNYRSIQAYDDASRSDELKGRLGLQKSDEKNIADKNTEDDSQDVLKSEYGSVISKSEDGDTVRATKQAEMSAALDGRVVVASQDGVVTEKDKAATEEEEKVSNFTGMTSQQIEVLYRQGKVTYGDYNKEIEKREELKEQINTLGGKEDDAEEKEDISTDSSSSLVSDDKDENKTYINNDEEDSSKTAVTSETTKKQTELLGEFDAKMGVINAIDDERKLEDIALATAEKTGNYDNITKFNLV